MEILGNFRIFSYSRKWNWRFPTLSVPYWDYWSFFFLDIASEALQSFVKICISRNFSFSPVNNIHNIFFLNILLCICVPCHQECNFHHFCGRYYLAVPMQFTNAQSPGINRRAQAVEAIGRETQAETLSLTPGFQCFCSSHPRDMARKADWQVGQEPGWEIGKKHRQKWESRRWKTKNTK